MDKKALLKNVVSAYDGYQKNALSNIYSFLYKDGDSIKIKTVGFTPDNFLHLTGIESRHNGRDFAKAIRRGKLTIKDLYIHDENKIKGKMSHINRICELFTSQCQIGIKTKQLASVDYIIGKDDVLIGLVSEQPFDRPSSLMYGKFQDLVNNEKDVIAVLAMPKDGKKINNQVLFIKDGTKIDSKDLPKSVLQRSTQEVLTALAEGKTTIAQNGAENAQEQQQQTEQKPNEGSEKPNKNDNGGLDLVAATLEQCGEKLDIELAQERARTQKENGHPQVGQVQQSQQVRQVGQVGQARQVKPGKQKIKNNGSSGK